jgi:YfiH family protein
VRRYPLRVEAWREIPGLVHGFLGRGHGLPPGPFTTEDVRDALVRAGEEPVDLTAARQVHGATVLGPEGLPLDPTHGDDLPVGDALVSASADLVLTIRTADCAPILLVAPRARAVAAVHAGWRGTVAGVIESALSALAARYGATADEVLAAVGPAIGGCCYTFGAEHREAFMARFGPEVAGAWVVDDTDQQATRLDLPAVCRLVLTRAGVPASAIATVGACTAEHPDELHSFRRDGPHAGRQLSYVGWSLPRA